MKTQDHLRSDPDAELAELRAENERLRDILTNAGGYLAVVDANCRVIWTHDTAEHHFGLPHPIIGRNCRESDHHTPEQCAQCPAPRAFASGQPETAVFNLAIASGQLRSYHLVANPIFDHNGDVVQVLMLSQDITERIQPELELQKQTEEPEIQNRRAIEEFRQKNRFIASLSHELKTPLTSIIGFTEILLEDDDNPLTAQQRTLLSKVSRSSERLLTMINDLLDLSKMGSGRMTVNISNVDISTLISEVLDTMQPLVRDKDIVLSSEIADGLPVMRTDEQKLCQILVNLISNGIKFTPSGTVQVTAAMAGGNIQISVTDTGIGIRRADFNRIFEEFSQVDTHRARRNGTGLGLAITRRLVHLLGGDIRLSSKFGHGSTFIVTLPVSLSEAISKRKAASEGKMQSTR